MSEARDLFIENQLDRKPAKINSSEGGGGTMFNYLTVENVSQRSQNVFVVRMCVFYFKSGDRVMWLL